MVLGFSIIALILLLFLLDCLFLKSYLKIYKNELNAILGAIIAFVKDFRNALSFGIAWMITNGWGWAFMFLGKFLKIKWMKIAGTTYIAFLFLPFVNEKVVTVALAVFIKKVLFRRKIEQPNNEIQNPSRNLVNLRNEEE